MIKILIFLFIALNASASISIKKVVVNCKSKLGCYSSRNLKKLAGTYSSKSQMDKLIKLVARQDGIKDISYILEKDRISFDVVNYPITRKIKIYLNSKIYEESLILPISVGDFLTPEINNRVLGYLKEYFSSIGYRSIQLSLNEIKYEDGTFLKYKVESAFRLKINEILINSQDDYLKNKIQIFFENYVGKSFEQINFNASVEELRESLYSLGYYFLDVNAVFKNVNDKVDINIFTDNTERQAFRISGISASLEQEIRNELKVTTRIYKRVLSDSSVKDIVTSNLRKSGYGTSKVTVKSRDFLDRSNLVQTTVNIDKFIKSTVSNISFRGNSYFSGDQLLKVFFENASEKASYNYLDTSYYNDFLNIIRRKYVEKGFASVSIKEPSVKFLSDNSARVIFKIIEGNRTKVSKLFINGTDNDDVIDETKFILDLEKLEYFNAIEFEQKLNVLKNKMSENGYYNFKITNEDQPDIIKYSQNNEDVIVTIELSLGNKMKFSQLRVFGNDQSKFNLIAKYLNMNRGELITRTKVKEFQSRLISLGIFKSVNVTPLLVDKENNADLIVQIKEGDFGVVELAPGIRSDLGPKLSASVSYNNLGGMNRVVAFKGQINKRLDLNTLDEERRDDKELVEYETELSFSENKILSSKIDFVASLSKARRRLYRFDADIQNLSYTFSTEFTKWFRASFTQQLETISQFNSTQEIQEGKFEIGSITPAFTFDFRNNRINPSSGSYFNLSFERASPYFKSQNDSDLKIDYYKVVLRNLFYIPFENGTFAISLAGGLQENLAKDRFNSANEPTGYIPNIKVFRLSGMDLVRGYDDTEINTLINGNDISDEIITNKAYMVNLKLEPRFFINDNFIAGAFFDAGRIFVDELKLDRLRASYGLTFKYLTPVGTLDFDYGIKVLRKKDSNGKLESPGRLHVSIGFF